MSDKKPLTQQEKDFFGGHTVEKRKYSIISDGRVTQRQLPVQVTYRIPASQVDYMKSRIDKHSNINYLVSKILEYGIERIEKELENNDFNIDDLKHKD